jgi:hypothetical protein
MIQGYWQAQKDLLGKMPRIMLYARVTLSCIGSFCLDACDKTRNNFETELSLHTMFNFSVSVVYDPPLWDISSLVIGAFRVSNGVRMGRSYEGRSTAA